MPEAPLLRCPTGGAGRYRVSLHVAHAEGEYVVQIGAHQPIFHRGSDGLAIHGDDGAALVLDQAPTVSTEKPFEGVLCEHELQFLDGVPGKDYRPEYEFTVEPID